MKKILSKFKKYQFPICAAILSIVNLIIGSIAVGFIPAFLIVLILDTILIVISLPIDIKNKKKKSKTKSNKVKTAKQDNKNAKTKENKKVVKKKKEKSIFKTIIIILFIIGIIVLLIGVAFLGYIIKTAPEFTTEKLYNKEATFVYDAEGEEMAKLGSEIRQKITYEDLSESLIDAIIATEDSRYFQHSGVDLPRFLKASVSQVLGKGGGGASTITMQVSKNAFTSTEDEGIEGIIRKFSDIYISVFKIETHYTKEQILEFYVNSNYLGGGAYGVEQASLNYFGKPAKDLNIAESAMIAGLFQAPNGYDPYINPKGCEQRRQTILYLMLRHGYINQTEYDIAKELTVEKLLVENEENSSATEYQDFINTVVSEVEERTGGLNPYEVPMKIYTTMNRKMQDNINNVMTGKTYTWKDDKAQIGSVVLDVHTGEIAAVAGNRNSVAWGSNYATDLVKQIGSTAKPLYDYGPAIEYNNWSTYTPIADEPYKYSNGASIKNWNSTFENFNTLQHALQYSRNVPALKAFQKVNNSKIKDFVTNLGLSPELDESGHIHEAHAFGAYNGESPLTLAAAYAAFSNGGYYIEPHSITLIEFTDSGETYEVKPTKRRAMSSETAYMITKILDTDEARNFAVGGSVNGVNYAVKSGTTNLDAATIKAHNLPSNAISDKWLASFNDSYAITLWYGYEILDSEYYLTSTDYSIKSVFRAIAKGVYTKKSTWEKPSGVVEAVVEDGLPTAMLASENTPKDLKVTAYFKKGFEPTETSTRFSELDNVTNLNYDETTNILSWDNIATPDFLDSDYLTKLYDPLFSNNNALKNQVKGVLEYNDEKVGKVIYDIYVKDSNGNLVYINSTETNSYMYPVSETTTFVVKTNYTILKTCESNGSEFTITKTPVIVTSMLNGLENINLKIGEVYIEPTNPVVVLENGLTDVTNNSIINKTIIRLSDNQIVNEISSTQVETYQITYNIIYKDYTYSLNRTINITQ